jgi:hypothetical protein
MRRHASLVLTLVAWLFATGSHWDLVQTFAWGRMLTTYSQSMPLLRAVEKTFSPEGRCELCHTVADAKQKESANDPTAPEAAGKFPGKILLVFAPGEAFFVFAPAPLCWSPSDLMIPLALREAPPVPPPRALA